MIVELGWIFFLRDSTHSWHGTLAQQMLVVQWPASDIIILMHPPTLKHSLLTFVHRLEYSGIYMSYMSIVGSWMNTENFNPVHLFSRPIWFDVINLTSEAITQFMKFRWRLCRRRNKRMPEQKSAPCSGSGSTSSGGGRRCFCDGDHRCF